MHIDVLSRWRTLYASENILIILPHIAAVVAVALALSCSGRVTHFDDGGGNAQNARAKTHAAKYVGNPPVLISEIYTANPDYKDEFGRDPGWVEFYNPSDAPVNLDGYYLTNDAANPARWRFGNVVVPPHRYTLVFMSKLNYPDESPESGGNVHASFTLANKGGTLYLTNGKGGILDSVSYPAATLGLSYARNVEDGITGAWAHRKPPTPRSMNSAETYKGGVLTPPSNGLPPSGHHAKSLSFTIPQGTNGAVVACDMTGALPSVDSEYRSGTAVNLTKTTVMRCIQFKEGAHPSPPTMRTYIIGRLPDLPIVSIAVDPHDMFDDTHGLYSMGPNAESARPHYGANFWAETELPVQIEFFEKGMKPGWSQPAGLRIFGNFSRPHPKKSVAITFRGVYGKGRLNYPLFPSNPELTRFKHFLLRNNGNNFERDYIRDMLMTSLSEGLGIDYQRGRAAVVFYNGEYWGIHNLRERMNDDYFNTKYGIAKNNVYFVKGTNDGSETRWGSDADYRNLISRLETLDSLSDDDMKRLEQSIDVDNYTYNFMCRMYYHDRDWPSNNMKRWRSNSPSSKWKWIMYDTDHGWGSYGMRNQPSVNTMNFVTAKNGPLDGSDWPNPPHATFLFRKLLTNENYKISFINRFSLVMATYFSDERVSAKIDSLMSAIESEIPHDQKRWNHDINRMNSHLNTIKTFNRPRRAQMQDELREYFGLGAGVPLTLSVSGKDGGKLFVHNLEVPSGAATFTAYPDVPITLKAVADHRYRFSAWSDGVTDPERELIVTAGQPMKLQAVFQMRAGVR